MPAQDEKRHGAASGIADREAPSSRDGDRSDVERALFDVVRETCRDLHRQPKRRVDVGLDSSFDRDLGLDSLARVELLLRVERAFKVRLAEDTLALAETPRDLLAALRLATDTAGVRPSATAVARPGESVHGEPVDATTLPEVLAWHVRRHPGRTQIIVSSAEGEEEISYGKLMLEATDVAARLQALGLEAKQSVALMLPTGPAYFYAYFGVLLAGGVPVPIYPPARPSQIEDHVRRHARILSNAQAVILVTVPEAMPVARLLKTVVHGLRDVIAMPGRPGESGKSSEVAVRSEEVAFIQYTSGSTGNPKGVVLTHANLLANIRAIGEAVAINGDDVFVSWLPLYHDMGLIAAWLASLYYGNPLVALSPLAFLARPESWLWAIHRHRGTLTAAPNFAYELCLKRIDDAQLEGLDLGSLRLAANGAEPVSPETVERFIGRFAKFGFRREAMTPVYGLAEATVALLAPPLGRGPLVDRVRREPFAGERKAVPAAPDDTNPLRFVACGRPLPGHRVRIVDEAGAEVGERVEGRLEFHGPSATAGYHRNP
ncbi:MAG TPA: AMP-binding protein, partial [Usitatibacteraceae bacterium]|nr:AMP-binding protein [Usitatibacteraceae bacterium]